MNSYSTVLKRHQQFLDEAGQVSSWYGPDLQKYADYLRVRRGSAARTIRLLVDNPGNLTLTPEPIPLGQLGDVTEWFGEYLPQVMGSNHPTTLFQLTDSLVDTYHIVCGAWYIESTSWGERIGGDHDYLFYWDYFKDDPQARKKIFEVPGTLFMNKGVQAMVMSYEFMISGEIIDAVKGAIEAVQGERNPEINPVISMEEAQASIHFLHLARICSIRQGKQEGTRWAEQFTDEVYPGTEIAAIEPKIKSFLDSQSRTTSSLWGDTYPVRTGGLLLQVFGRDNTQLDYKFR